MSEKEEIWKNVVGYEKAYQVSNFGNVRSLDRVIINRIGAWCFIKGINLKKRVVKGYEHVNLSASNKGKGQLVHRLAGIAFLENPNNYPVLNHMDGNKLNNNIENLEWCTHSHNTQHSWRIGLSKKEKGGNCYQSQKVINLKTNEIFPTIKESFKESGYSCLVYFRKKLKGVYPNDTYFAKVRIIKGAIIIDKPNFYHLNKLKQNVIDLSRNSAAKKRRALGIKTKSNGRLISEKAALKKSIYMRDVFKNNGEEPCICKDKIARIIPDGTTLCFRCWGEIKC